MGFVPFENCARFELRYIYAGQHVENVFHVSAVAPPWSPEEHTAIASAFKTWWNGSIKPFVPNTCSLVEIASKELDVPIAPGYSYVTGLPLVGADAGAALPNSVTFAVKWSTMFTGRSYRGRSFHVGIAETQVNGNELDATYRTSMQNAYNALPPLITAAGGVLVVASRITAGEERFAGTVTTILSASVDPTVDSQRRRLPGRGN